MKILYTTDIHGYKRRYKTIQQAAYSEKVDIISFGADILPKQGNDIFQSQFGFLNNFLSNFLKELNKDFRVLIDYGNDDLACYYLDFLRIVNNLENCFFTNFHTFELDGLKIRGYNWVPDYPFGLKDWCKIDLKTSSPCPTELSPPVMSTREGYKRIEKLDVWMWPSIEEVFDIWLKDVDKEEIWFMHSPPKMLGLDVTNRGESVGSSAITNAIINKMPRITFHGHIHESMSVTNKCCGFLTDQTLSIQPGTPYSYDEVSYVILDLNEGRHPKVRYNKIRCDSSVST